MMQRLLNSMKSAVLQAQGISATTRHGTVSSYDPNAYAVKVTLQPDGVETGWLPLKSVWIGNGWGLFCPPSIGDAVELDFQEADTGTGSVGLRFYNDADRPLPCPSGEFWLVHKSGSLLKFHNDGSVELHTAQDLHATVGGNASVAVQGSIASSAAVWDHTGTINIHGGDVTADGISLKTHIHGGVTPGGGDTAGPHQ